MVAAEQRRQLAARITEGTRVPEGRPATTAHRTPPLRPDDHLPAVPSFIRPLAEMYVEGHGQGT